MIIRHNGEAIRKLTKEAPIYSDFVAAMFGLGKMIPYILSICCVTIFPSCLVLLRTRNNSELP
jgi:hypothetical protein